MMLKIILFLFFSQAHSRSLFCEEGAYVCNDSEVFGFRDSPLIFIPVEPKSTGFYFNIKALLEEYYADFFFMSNGKSDWLWLQQQLLRRQQ